MTDDDRMAMLLAECQKQAHDEGLWFTPTTVTEAYLQLALRQLTAIVENVSMERCALDAFHRIDREWFGMEQPK